MSKIPSEQKRYAIHQLPSEHFSDRDPAKGGGVIDTIVIHTMHNSVGGDPFDPKLCKQVLDSYKVSTHYFIDRKGDAWQLVQDEKKAWHAGISVMPPPDNRPSVNEFSIGIELFAMFEGGLEEVQYQTLIALIEDLRKKFPIKNIVGHSEVAPGRKDDPWGFDWSRVR